MRASVLITTYNRLAIFRRTLPTVLDQDFPPDEYEVVVVVDGSTDGTAEWLRTVKAPCPLRVIAQQNMGQAGAENTGLRACRGELVILIDDEILCDRALVRGHVAGHERSATEVVYGPVLLAPDAPDSFTSDWVRFWTGSYDGTSPEEVRARPFPEGIFIRPNTSAPRSLLVDAGGFDPTYRNALDVEFGLRLWRMGIRARFDPGPVAYQIPVKRARYIACKDGTGYGRDEVLICRKHPVFREVSSLSLLGEGRPWRRRLRNLLVRMPISPCLAFHAAFWLTERIPFFRRAPRAGFHLLERWRLVMLYRGALRTVGSWQVLQQEFGRRVPALVIPQLGQSVAVSSARYMSWPAFQEHLEWLSSHRFQGIRVGAWQAWRDAGTPLPPRPVMLMVGAAGPDDAEHLQILFARHAFQGTVLLRLDELRSQERLQVYRCLAAKIGGQPIEFGLDARGEPSLERISAAAKRLADAAGIRVAVVLDTDAHPPEARAALAHAAGLVFGIAGGPNTLHTRADSLRCLPLSPTSTTHQLRRLLS